jgi:cation diffusion facilitator CzcD-associated flavoprotein CzcO
MFPKFLPKEKIADFLEAYAIGQEIHVWLSSQIVSAPVYDDCTRRWSVEVDRAGKRVTVMPRHILVATGSTGEPRIPRWLGMESFKGQMYHSDEHRGAASFKGKRVVVIGAVCLATSGAFLGMLI